MNISMVQKKAPKKVVKKKKKVVKKKPKPKKKIKPKPKPKPKKIIKPKPLPPKVVEKLVPIIEEPKIIEEEKEIVPPEPVVEEVIEEEILEDNSAQVMASKKELYFASIYDSIGKHKKYPKKAKKFKQQGDVKVRFDVDAEGKISNFMIVEKSKYKSLDKAVKKMFKKLKYFEKPPPELELPLEISITISYTLK